MTCLCLTRNRREWLPQAIACFLQQIYPNRELLILSDGADVRDLVPADPRIRLLHLAYAGIGEKRNFGCSQAAGDLVAHWDDDDYSAPERLADQVSRLLAAGKAVTGYRSMRFSDGEKWWRYEGKPTFALGTSLVYRKTWWETHRFPALQIGEDNCFVEQASAAGQLVTAEAQEMMYASIHPGNTSPRRMGGSMWKLIA